MDETQACAVKPEMPLQGAAGNLGSNIKTLEDIVSRLRLRLSPVMRTIHGNPGLLEKTCEAGAPVVDELNGYNSQIKAINSDLDEILKHLEL